MALYTYNIYTNTIRQGLPLTSNRSNPKNPMQTMPPHLMCGEMFVALNFKWQHPPIQGGMLLRADLERIEPAGKKPFYVLSRATKSAEEMLLFIETTPPRGVKSRIDMNQLNTHTGLDGEGFEVILADRITGAALVRCVEGATVDIFLPDGRVELIGISDGEPRHIRQTQKQMAALRVTQLTAQLERSVDNVKWQHGIIGSAIRLLKTAHDDGAIDELVSFLADNVAKLTDRMRRDVRERLLEIRHPLAGTFLDGFESNNVVRIQSPEAAAKRAQSEKRRRERSERDRERTATAKSGGKGDTQKSGGKQK